MVFPDLSVAENVFISHRDRGRIVDRRRMGRDAQAVLDRLGVRLDVNEPARGLTPAEQQTLEIAKAISLKVRVLILDEPTASLSAHEARRLFRIIRALRDDGVAILFISHRMEEVFEIAERVTVLRDGRWISTHPTSETNPRHGHPRHGRPAARAALRADADRARARWCSRSVTWAWRASFPACRSRSAPGEVVGLAGLVGARRTDVGPRPVRDRAGRHRRDPHRRRGGHDPEPAGGAAPWHRLHDRGSPRPWSHLPAVDRSEHLAADAAALCQPVRHPPAQRRGGHGRRFPGAG